MTVMNSATESNDPECLAELSRHPRWQIRHKVAMNVFTPPEILRILSNDKKQFVVDAVFWNNSIPLDILTKLATSDKWTEKSAAALNPSTPVELLHKLSCDDDDRVRFNVIQNQNISLDSLFLLASDLHEDVRRGVAVRKDTRDGIRKIWNLLIKDESIRVRYYIAFNTSVPTDLLLKLTHYPNKMIRCGLVTNEAIIDGLMSRDANSLEIIKILLLDPEIHDDMLRILLERNKR